MQKPKKLDSIITVKKEYEKDQQLLLQQRHITAYREGRLRSIVVMTQKGRKLESYKGATLRLLMMQLVGEGPSKAKGKGFSFFRVKRIDPSGRLKLKTSAFAVK